MTSTTDTDSPSQFATQSSVAQAFTGPQTNYTAQGDNDLVYADAGAQAINLGGNASSSTNSATVTSVSARAASVASPCRVCSAVTQYPISRPPGPMRLRTVVGDTSSVFAQRIDVDP